MGVGEERLRLGERRRLVFENFCNMVPKELIAETFEISVFEVERDIKFVARKIKEYRHKRCLQPVGIGELHKVIAEWEKGGKKGQRPPAPLVDHPMKGLLPPIPCDTEDEVIMHRGPLRQTLDYIGPETLSTELLLPTLTTQNIRRDDPQAAMQIGEATRAVRGNVREEKAA